MSANNTLNYIHQDHLTGTSLVTSDNGILLGSTKYYPYGECRNSQSEIDDFATDKLFTGQRLDSTGLYFYGARYYDPLIGRFISPDIFIQNNSNPQSFNRYSYCLSNPLKYNDPTGWWTFGIKIGIKFSLFGVNVGFSGGVVFDTSGGIAWIGEKSAGFGLTVASAAVDLYFPVTSKDYVTELRGKDSSIGGSTDIPNVFIGRAGVDVGVDYSGSGGEVSIGVGLGAGPGEVHWNQTETGITVIRPSSKPSLPLEDKHPNIVPVPSSNLNNTKNQVTSSNSSPKVITNSGNKNQDSSKQYIDYLNDFLTFWGL